MNFREGAGFLDKRELDFDQIYHENAGRVLNLCFRMTGNEQAARDLAQDVWVKVLRNLSQFEGKSAVSTWLYRISVNHVKNYYKSEKRRRLREVLNLDILRGWNEIEEQVDDYPDPQGETPADPLQQKERSRIVWEMVQKLPEKQKLPLILFRYEDLSYQEISEILGVSISSVESRLHRAKISLQKMLEPFIGKI